MGAPVAVRAREANRIETWGTGAVGQMYTANYKDNRGTWNGSFAVCPTLPGLPSVAPLCVISRLPGPIDVFVTGPDGQIYTAIYADERGTWQGWLLLLAGVSGLPPGAPVSVLARALGGGHWLDAFVIGAGGRMYTASYNDARGSWIGWVPIP